MKSIVIFVFLASFLNCFAQSKIHRKEKDGFEWYEYTTVDVSWAEDAKGNVIIPRDSGYFLIKYSPEEVLYESKKDKYKSCSLPFFEVRKKGGLRGVYDKKGNFIFIKGNSASDSEIEGYNLNGFKYYIYVSRDLIVYDSQGNVIIGPQYDKITGHRTENYDYFEVEIGNKKGILDSQGNVIIGPQYDKITGHRTENYDYFEVEIDNKKGILDSQGRIIVLPLDYKGSLSYHKGFFETSGDGIGSYHVSNKVSSYPLNNRIVLELTSSGIEKLKKASEYLQDNQYKKTIELCDKLIKEEPTALAYFYRGYSYYRSGTPSKALENFRYVLYRDDCPPDIHEATTELMESAEQTQNMVRRSKILAKKERSEKWNRILSNLATLGETLYAVGNALSSNSSDVQSESTSYNSSGTGSAKEISGSSKKSSGANHANWSSLERSYSSYESQLIRLSNSTPVDKQEVRSIQRKMREIREKIATQSGGHQRAVSQWENWNP